MLVHKSDLLVSVSEKEVPMDCMDGHKGQHTIHHLDHRGFIIPHLPGRRSNTRRRGSNGLIVDLVWCKVRNRYDRTVISNTVARLDVAV